VGPNVGDTPLEGLIVDARELLPATRLRFRDAEVG